MNPYFTSWLIHGDKFTSFLGSQSFLIEDFTKNFGVINSLGFKEHIVFLDTVPIMALVTKILCKLFNLSCLNIQYFGIWYFICFVLQIYSSFLISKIIFKDNYIQVLCSTLLIAFIPSFFVRISFHPSLSAFFLIYFQIFFLFFKKSNIKYFISLLISFLVHPYFLAYGAFVLLIYLGSTIDKKKLIDFKTLIFFIFSIILYYFFLELSGFFSIPISSQGTEGFGDFNTNLNFPINSYQTSLFFDDLKYYNPMQLDGFGYFGLGFLLITFLIFLNMFFNYKVEYELVKQNKFFIVSILICFFYAIYGNVSFNDHLLFKLTFLNNLPFVDIFRSNGRFIIIVNIFLFIFFLKYVALRTNTKYLSFIILFIFSIQMIDIYASKKILDFTYSNKSYDTSIKNDSDLNNLLFNNKNEIIFLNKEYNFEIYANLIQLANQHKSKINISFNSRRDNVLFEENIDNILLDLSQNIFKKNTLYLFAYNENYLSIKDLINYSFISRNENFKSKLINNFYIYYYYE